MGKIRSDFVTNSSSSSFIISRDAVTKDELKKILLEIANREAKWWNWDEDEPETDAYTEEDIVGDTVAHRYIITEIIGKGKDDYFEREEENVFIVDNDDCGRYDWDVIEKVLSEYGIDWHRGYCD